MVCSRVTISGYFNIFSLWNCFFIHHVWREVRIFSVYLSAWGTCVCCRWRCCPDNLSPRCSWQRYFPDQAAAIYCACAVVGHQRGASNVSSTWTQDTTTSTQKSDKCAHRRSETRLVEIWAVFHKVVKIINIFFHRPPWVWVYVYVSRVREAVNCATVHPLTLRASSWYFHTPVFHETSLLL